MNGQQTSRSGQVAAELRRRIETGELAPGDRVPSTREITRRWGVAMATATKALTELRQQGLVRAVPGVGTVVATPNRQVRTGRSRNATTDQALTLKRIVAAAVAVADAEGPAAVSMRRVATELGAATMSLYRHVTDKDDLLLRMMDAALGTWSFPEDPPGGWREQLTLAARMLWQVFRRHPWLAPALSLTRPQAVPNALPFTEWVLTSLDGRGLDLSTAFTAHITLFNYVRGTAINLEMEAEAEALSGLDNEEWMSAQEPAMQALLDTGRLPMLQRVTTTGYDFDLEAVFEFGLQRLLDGLAVLLHDPPATADAG